MSKPDWKDAPEGFEFLAQDGDGEWFWWIEKPYPDYKCGYWMSDFKTNDCRQASPDCLNLNIEGWHETLEHRP